MTGRRLLLTLGLWIVTVLILCTLIVQYWTAPPYVRPRRTRPP